MERYFPKRIAAPFALLLSALGLALAIVGATSLAPASSPVAAADGPTVTSVVMDPITGVREGQMASLRAVVTPAEAEGVVTISAQGYDFDLTVRGGVAEGSMYFPDQGEFVMTATFASTGAYLSSSTSQVITILPTLVGTSLTLAPVGEITAGESKTLTATVTPAEAMGVVQFAVGGVQVGGPVPLVDGVATVTYRFDTGGTLAIAADFIGADRYGDSFAETQTVTVPDPEDGAGESGSLGSLALLVRLFQL